MSIDNPDINGLVTIVKPSETLSCLLQNAATEARSEAMSLVISEAMTRFTPSSSSVNAVLRDVAGISSNISAHVARSNNIHPREIQRQYGVVICQKGPLDFTNTLAAVVIRLFDVERLDIRVSDLHGNKEEVDWEKGSIAVLAEPCTVDLSGNGKLVAVVLTYMRKPLGNVAGQKITEL